MLHSPFTVVLARFWAGTLGGVAAGLVVFRLSALDPGHLGFQCITVGGLTAGILTLMRSSLPDGALILAAGFAVLRLGAARNEGLLQASSGIVLAAGIYLAALIFDLLARRGLPFGKFLILGPLLGGTYLAAAPLMAFDTMISTSALHTVLEHLFLGVVIGNGVGLGVEIADLTVRGAERARGEGRRGPASGSRPHE